MTNLLVPTTVVPPPLRADDPRIGNLIRFSRDGNAADGTRIVIVGFPSDEGVRINGGRVGAALGPDRIRHWLYRFTPDARCYDAHAAILEQTVDLGNAVCGGDVAADQERLGEVLSPLIQRGIIPIVLGGGHETAFGHFLGYVLAGRNVSILNIDAHPDVRPLVDGRPHSGSPFRQALEHPSGACWRYIVAGLNPHTAAKSHLEFIAAHGGRWHWNDAISMDEIEGYFAEGETALMTTFDLDAVDQSHAPGVSAPNATGLAVEVWFNLAYRAGRSQRVSSFDLVELNPTVDVDERTARLAALTVANFLRGVAARPERI